MGASAYRSLLPNLYSNHQPLPLNSAATQHYPFELGKRQKPPLVLLPLTRGDCWVEYQVTVSRLNFTVRVIRCPVAHSQQFSLSGQNLYGVVKKTNGDCYFKKRIPIDNGNLEAALQEFCFRKIMAILEVGENIGHLFGYDLEVYDGYIQYAAELLVYRHKLFTAKETQEQIEANVRVLARYGLCTPGMSDADYKQRPPSQIVGYSASFKKYVFINLELAWNRSNTEWWQSDFDVPAVQSTQHQSPQNSGLLSVQSNNQAQYDKMVRVHQNTIKQLVRSRQSVNTLEQHMNRLQNYIYMNNIEQQKCVKQKIERQFIGCKNPNKTVFIKYHRMLEHFYERAGREYEQLLEINMIQRVLPDGSGLGIKRYVLERDQKRVVNSISQVSALEKSHHSNLSGVYLALARIRFEEEEIPKESLEDLAKGCSLEDQFQNNAYLQAGSLLFQYDMLDLAKEYLWKGIDKGYKIGGELYLNNSRLYNCLGLIFSHQGDLPCALKVFNHSLSIYKSKRLFCSDYFMCVSNIICILDKLQEFDQGYRIYLQIIKSLPSVSRIQKPSDYLTLFCNLGNFLFNSSRYQQARTMFSVCLKYPATWPTLSPDSYIKMFSNLGCLQVKDRQATKAETYFKYAVEKQRQVGLIDVMISCSLHNNVGVFLYKKSDYRKSVMELEQVMEWIEGTSGRPGDNREEVLMHLNYNIGCVYRKILKTDQALQYFEQAERLAWKLFGNAHIYSTCIRADIQTINRQRILQLSAQHDESTSKNVSMVRGNLNFMTNPIREVDYGLQPRLF